MRTVSRQPSEAPAARISPLSVLPVFYDLRGSRAVVAGGSDAAAWKAELLAAAGARLEIWAPSSGVGHEMRRLLASEAGRLRHVDAHWSACPLAGAAIAVADAQDEAEAAAFAAAAAAAGVPHNVIDRPRHCGFQFGSIVNRSPVVVGISTSGAAPILGQAVRRRIETLLPASLALWGGLAQRVRERVNGMREAGFARRAFWESMVDRAFAGMPDADDDVEFESILAGSGLSAQERGHVTFVGAGPGDAEHLTLKAVRALQAADVVLFDDLVSDDVLEFARREARRILVGKRAGRPSCRQHEINGMMVKLAKAGRRVVRLKSGDPMIFGRAGEETAALDAAGIGYDVVPGITAGLALAARLGVSLTHRNRAKSVRFVTGHSKNGGLPADLDWSAIADPSATTIFYMGGRTAAEISGKLISLGLARDTPVAIAASLGRPGETIRVADLESMPRAVDGPGMNGPVLIGLGEVFRRSQLETKTGIRRLSCGSAKAHPGIGRSSVR